MAKIEIIGLLEDLDTTLEILQNAGTVQIEEIPTVESSGQSHLSRIHLDEKKELLLARYEELSSNLREITESLSEEEVDKIPLDDTERERLMKLSPDELIKHITPISREIRRLARQHRNLIQDMESTQQYETLVNVFLPLLEKSEVLENMEQIGIILKRGEDSVLQVLKNRIDELTGTKTLFFHQDMPDGKIGVFIAVTHDDLSAVRQLLGAEGVAEYHMPREFRKKNLSESIIAIRSKIEEIPPKLLLIEKQLIESKKKNSALINFLLSFCIDRISQLKILSRLVRTKFTFVVSGWLPVSSLKNLKQLLADSLGDRIYFGRIKLSDIDYLNIPTLLSNRGVFKSFEVLMKLLPPPKYENVDATPLISIFFPLFFGIILGDMAYGLVLLAISGLLKWKSARGGIISNIGTVGLAAGFSTVFFGFLFGEFLGDFGVTLELPFVKPWLHRTEAIKATLLIAIGLGVLHVILGFAIKTYVGMIMRHTKGIIEGLAKIAIIIGVILIFIQLFLEFPLFVRHAAFAIIGVGFMGVVATEGIIGILEMFTVFGNILSYSRIMAIGLASAILATVANRLAEASPNIILGILVGFSIHLINFVLGVFSPSIHSLRLHYVEFFSKFYKPQGKIFNPFKKIGGDIT
ncbi:V-type ATP synthase subunit I [Candidatus Latescibacterota bacterium]